jgi:hypothetical protein
MSELVLFIPIDAINPIIRLSGLNLYEFGEGVTSLPQATPEGSWLTSNWIYLIREEADKILCLSLEVQDAKLDGKKIFGVWAGRLADAMASFERDAVPIVKGEPLPPPKRLARSGV